jgi:ABC-type multidrug transport system ATPase subunit
LDEPTVGLDGRGWRQLLDWMVERRAAGGTMLVVTHEMEFAARADRVIGLHNGRVVADGIPDVVIPRLDSAVVS